MMLSAAGCGARVTRISDSSSPGGGPGAADYFKTKCKSDVGDCMSDAAKQCAGAYTVIHEESHAGGILADLLPGPVTWYTVTFRCGAAAERVAMKAHEDALAAFVMPRCQSDWEGRCGLLTDKLEFGARIDSPALAIEGAAEQQDGGGGLLRVAAAVCDERADRLSEACHAEFRRGFITMMRTRYPHAQDQRLLSWCEQHPSDCDPSKTDRLRLLELDFLTAHDRAVLARFEQTADAAVRQQSADTSLAAQQERRASGEESVRRTREQMVRAAVAQMNQR